MRGCARALARSVYRRPLPSQLIAFASPEGRQLFAEALQAGGLENYFDLAQHFQTQDEPAYCGLTTLAIVLNTLGLDPNREWKGIWRWYSEDVLDCCVPLDLVKEGGINFDEFSCLAECNGANVEAVRAENSTFEEFEEIVKAVTSKTNGNQLVIAFSRPDLGQTGGGHFSPVAGYHQERKLLLVLDVARFKYPPYWVDMELAWEAMHRVDTQTGRSRGYLKLANGGGHHHHHEHHHPTENHEVTWTTVQAHFADRIPQLAETATCLREWTSGLIESTPAALLPCFSVYVRNTIHRADAVPPEVVQFYDGLTSTALHQLVSSVSESLGAPYRYLADVLIVMLVVFPPPEDRTPSIHQEFLAQLGGDNARERLAALKLAVHGAKPTAAVCEMGPRSPHAHHHRHDHNHRPACGPMSVIQMD